ncbi:hypothetical protein AY599_00360 [Leptolyngbya valderiana BDU 20041]|nr:hypothetical protein AY599_00360 [Leptolyngbya valderiana BDU 20041]
MRPLPVGMAWVRAEEDARSKDSQSIGICSESAGRGPSRSGKGWIARAALPTRPGRKTPRSENLIEPSEKALQSESGNPAKKPAWFSDATGRAATRAAGPYLFGYGSLKTALTARQRGSRPPIPQHGPSVRPGQAKICPGQAKIRPDQTQIRPGQTQICPGQTASGAGRTAVGPGRTAICAGKMEVGPGETTIRATGTQSRLSVLSPAERK